MSKGFLPTGKIIPGEPSLETIDDIRRAEIRIDHYKLHFNIVAGQMTGLSKWLTASLFAINSAGIVTIISNSDKIHNLKIVGCLFVIGLLFALLNAAINQEIYNRLSEPLTEMIGYWGEVSISGQSDPNKLTAIDAKMTKLHEWSWLGPLFGWASGLAFIGSCLLIILNIP
ncbi:MAG: hypothetical protein WA948_02755 [Pontixanthobacter sp.]